MVRTSESGSGSGDNTSDSRGSYGGGYTGGSFGDSSDSDNIGGGSSGNDGGGAGGGAPEDDGGGFDGSGDSDPTTSITRRSTVSESVFDESGGTLGNEVDPALGDPSVSPSVSRQDDTTAVDPTTSITRRSTVSESVFDESGGTLGNEVDPALGDPSVSSSVPRQVETTAVDPTSTASDFDVDVDASTTRNALAGAALAGVAAPEPVSSGAGAAVLGGLAAGAIVADTVRRSELDPSEFNRDIPELQPGQRNRNELEPGQRQQNELDAPSNDQIGQSELGIGEQLNQPEITIGESTSGSTGSRPADETVVPGDYPLPGRDVPADPSQEFIDRSPDPSDVIDSSTSTAVDSAGATVDQPSSPTINDGFDSPTIEEDEPGFETPREFPSGGGSSRINDETVDPEVGTGTQTTEITETISPTVAAEGPALDPGLGGFGAETEPEVNPGTSPGNTITPVYDPTLTPTPAPDPTPTPPPVNDAGPEIEPGTGTGITPEREELVPIFAQAAVDSGNQLANRTPQGTVQQQPVLSAQETVQQQPVLSAQAAVESGNQLANRTPQETVPRQKQQNAQLTQPSLGQGQQFETSFNFNVPSRFRLRPPDDDDEDEEPDLLSTETDSSLFDSGISSGEELSDQLFGSSR